MDISAPSETIEVSSEVIAPVDAELQQPKSDEDILKEAKLRFALCKESEQGIKNLALDDLKFISGEQWPDRIKQERENDGRPCLVINRLPQFVQQVTNDQRQNRPSIKVHPVSDGADVATAKVIQGLIRHIEYNSNAEVAYDTALESAARGGFGYFRVVTDYVAPDSFDQEIYIRRIRDPLTVSYDPFSQEPDGSDANFAFVEEDLSKDEYKSKFPQSEISRDDSAWGSAGSNEPEWVRKDGVRIVEYFYKDIQEKRIHLLKTGETVTDKELPSRIMAAAQANIDASPVRSRIAKVPVVKWCKLNGSEILERTEWPGSHIPIIPVYGNELFINGKRILESVIRHAKDVQRMKNFWKSAEAEAIALAPRAPFIAAEGQLEGYEQDWKSANRKNHAFLYYKPTTIAGQQAPPPQRQAAEPAIQAISMASQGADQDLYFTTGIYPSATGDQSNEISGVAIKTRQSQAQTANFHFVDNLNRSLKHAGRILVDLIPKIYDTERAQRIIGEDGEQEIVQLNRKYQDPKSGKEVLYNLDCGRYDVTVDTGPSFASKRQEAAAAMLEVTRAYPKLMDIAGDVFIKNQDWPGAQDIAERVKRTLPPQVVGDQKVQQIPPQVQAQMAHMNQMIQQLCDQRDEMLKVIETKSMELQHKERIELMKQQFEVAKLEAELGSKESIALLEHQVAEIQNRLTYLNMNAPIEAPNNFDPNQADGGNYQGIGHVGGSANIADGNPSEASTGGHSPGQIPGENP